MPYCQLDDLELFYEYIGFGEPILFLHSHYNRGILAFACQMQAFHKTYRCLLPDFRGNGRTKSPNPEWGIPMNVRDMADFLDRLGIPRAHLIGYGGGSVTGFHFAIEHPDRAASLTSIGFSGLPYHVDLFDTFSPEALLRDGRYDIINEINRKHNDAHRGDWQGYLRRTLEDDRDHTDLGEARIAGMRTPLLIVAGETDPYSTPAQHARMRELRPDCEVSVCPGGSHRPHMVGEHTVIVNRVILDFLTRHAFTGKIEGILPVAP